MDPKLFPLRKKGSNLFFDPAEHAKPWEVFFPTSFDVFASSRDPGVFAEFDCPESPVEMGMIVTVLSSRYL